MRYSPLRFIPSILHKSRPIHLTAFLTRKCNASCEFCFYPKQSGEGGGEITLDELEQVARTTGNLLWLALSGGEIFLREDLPEIVRVFYNHTRPSIILLPTNGLLPERIEGMVREILGSTPKSTVVVKVSLDGLGSLHDTIRGREGAYERVLETCNRLSPLIDKFDNFELGINTVYCKENQSDMDGIIDHVRAMQGINTHTISLLRAGNGLLSLDIKGYMRAADRLAENMTKGPGQRYRFAGSRLKAAQDVIQRKLIYKTVVEDRRMLPCYAGALNAVLTETGEVYACESFREEHYLGSIRESGPDLPALLRTPEARAKVRAIRQDCYCSHECYMMTNILFNPSFYPTLLAKALRVK